MKMPKRNRILPFLLAAFVATALVLCVFAANGDGFAIRHNGAAVSHVTFAETERTELSLQGAPAGAELQWQLRLTDGETWVDISGQTGETLTLSYALVGSLLDSGNSTAVRCAAVSQGSEAIYTAPVTVTVAENAVVPQTEEITQDTGSDGIAETLAPQLPLDGSLSEPPQMNNPAPQAEGDGDTDALADSDIVTITIQYLYVDRLTDTVGDPVWSPYIAYIEKGTDFSATVANKTVPGYKAVLAEDYDGATRIRNDTREAVDDEYTGSTSIKLDLTKVEEDITFTVYYKEIQVNYYARYYLQNITNDLYTEDTSAYSEFQGYQGEQPSVDAVNKTITGFTSMFYQPDKIAADGSTVFEVYYDRNYYLINFDLNGGYGTSPVYARYQTTFTVAEPTRHGYVFAGWKLIQEGDKVITDGAVSKTLPTTIPANNMMYQAVWTTEATTYTVVYWLENANDDEYSYFTSRVIGADTNGDPDESVKSGDGVSAAGHSGNTDVFGEDAPYLSYNASKTLQMETAREDYDSNTGKVIVEGDGSTVLNVYFDRKDYTLKFYYAMSSGSGDGITYYVVGGSTYGFGRDASVTDKDNEISLLSDYLEGGGWSDQTGIATEEPTLNARGLSRNYEVDTDEVTLNDTEYLYYFISFQAKYGADISNLWPCDVFNSVTMNDDSTSWSNSNEAFVSAWNGEYNVYYSQHYANQTIKGNYQKLDRQLLWENGDPADMTVSYLCFWENGASVGWSVPELYIYNIWLSCIGNDVNNAPAGKEIREKDGVFYYLDNSYNTCDDSNIPSQTVPSIQGYVFKVRNWHTYFISECTYSQNDNTYYDAGGAKVYIDGQVWSGNWEYKVTFTIEETLNNRYLLYDPNLYNPDSPGTVIDHDLYREAYGIDIYYTRNNHKLYYRNHNKNMGDGSGADVPYGKPLAIYGTYFTQEEMQIKHYPTDLEPNAYVFAGWYTTADFLPGTEMDWSGTMPDSDLTVYAKWEPVVHTVQFYLDYDKLTAGTQYGTGYSVSHGTVMETPGDISLVPTHPTDPGYKFVEWFYIKDGKKVAFEPSTMTVQQDLKLYAEWTSSQITDYTVRYAKANQDGTLVTDSSGNVVYIADPTTGYAFEATTKTFSAKPVEALNLLPEGEKDQLWLPLTNSHSILMKKETETYQNTFTFGYVTRENAPYTVRYVDSGTGAVLETKNVETNHAAVVTEQFIYIEGYIPDAFYKQLVLSANEAENVITFYYTKETTEEPEDPDNPDPGDTGTTAKRTLYLVTHYIQDLDDPTSYTEYRSDTFIDEIGAYVNGTRIDISGFAYKETDAGGAKWDDENQGYYLDEEGIELKLYYDRNKYDYTVKYLERGTDKILQENKIVADVAFGTDVPENASSIAGYDLYSSTPQTLSIGTDESKNVITFYYVAKQITINYVPVCTDKSAVNFGDVSRNVENPTTLDDISGASAITRDGFRFVGWYSDAELQNLVADTKNYKPEIPNNYAEKDTYDFTYYALFEPVREELVISKQAAAGTSLDSNDSFLFQVTGTDVLGNNVNLLVTIQGAGSVTVTGLYCGTYTVTELTGWSWTYGCGEPAEEVTLSSTDSVTVYTVTFTNTPVSVDWLHGETYSEEKLK